MAVIREYICARVVLEVLRLDAVYLGKVNLVRMHMRFFR